jgi:inosine/xanthosine triphosphatase
VAELEGRTYLTGAVAVRDREGRAHIGWSPWIELPAWTVTALKRSSGRELGEIMDERAGTDGSKHKNGSWGLLTDDRITRAESFRFAILAAFAPWASELYRDEPASA